MNRRIVFTLVWCFLWGIGFSQPSTSTHLLTLHGDFKKSPKFDTEKVQVRLSVSEEANQVLVGIELLNAGSGYNLYIFDQVALEGSKASDWKTSFDVAKWARSVSVLSGMGLSGGKTSYDFDGNFIRYNNQFLNRTQWIDEEGYKQIIGKIEDFDKYAVINTVELPASTLEYVFLVTEPGRALSETFLGITNPIIVKMGKQAEAQNIVQVPANAVQQTTPPLPKTVEPPKIEPKPELKQPQKIETVKKVQEEDLVLKWENYINNTLLKPFTEKGAFDYEDIAKDKMLNLDYEQGSYNDKIERALTNMEIELADDKYRDKRNELWSRLNSFRKIEIIAPIPEEISEEKKVADMNTEMAREQALNISENKREINKPSNDNTSGQTEVPTNVIENKVLAGSRSESTSCIDSVVFYHRRMVKLDSRLSMNSIDGDKFTYIDQFKNDSTKFVTFSGNCSHSSTSRYIENFGSMSKRIVGNLYSNRIVQNTNDNKTTQFEYTGEYNKELGNKAVEGNKTMRFILIALIAAIFIGMFVFVFKGKK